MKTFRPTLLSLAFLATTAAALAHPGHGPVNSFAGGVLHPLTGWDHILAMVAIGLWAAQLRAPLLVPGAFVGAMAVGAAVGHHMGAVSGLDQGIAATVLILGLLIASSARVPLAAAASLAAAFAVFHGWAHGAEMPATAGGLAFGAGFLVATVALLAAGVGVGYLLLRRQPVLSRWTGAAIALAGIAMALA